MTHKVFILLTFLIQFGCNNTTIIKEDNQSLTLAPHISSLDNSPKSLIKKDLLYLDKHLIKIYSYKLDQDTVVFAYYDINAPLVVKESIGNLGGYLKDRTSDSITKYIWSIYPNASIGKANLKEDQLCSFKQNFKIDANSRITIDCYRIETINHYIQKKNKSANDYYKLASAHFEHNITNVDKIIPLLDSVIFLDTEFEKAYLFKARLLEQKGIMNGAIMSEPHMEVVDLTYIKSAINCLETLLKIKPQNLEANRYKNELIIKYKSS